MISTSIHILEQLQAVLLGLGPEQYRRPLQVMDGGTVGKHTRHIIELYLCVFKGYERGEVCYDSRKRDPALEEDRDSALRALENIKNQLHREDKELNLIGSFEDETFDIPSNYKRELLYNLEHCIHHLALIRPALRELGMSEIPESFGVAPSTMAYRKKCAH